MMKTYYDDIVDKKMFVCEDGCNTTTNPEWTSQQCMENTTKECMFIFHNKHCICNKGRLIK